MKKNEMSLTQAIEKGLCLIKKEKNEVELELSNLVNEEESRAPLGTYSVEASELINNFIKNIIIKEVVEHYIELNNGVITEFIASYWYNCTDIKLDDELKLSIKNNGIEDTILESLLVNGETEIKHCLAITDNNVKIEEAIKN